MPTPAPVTQTVSEMREERRRAVVRIRELSDRINAERRDFRADEQADWDRVNADHDRLTRAVQAAEAADAAERESRRHVGDRDVGREDYDARNNPASHRRANVQHTEEQRGHAFAAWCRWQMGMGLTREQEEACRELRVNPGASQLRLAMWDDRRRAEYKSRLRGTHPSARGDLAAREVRANMSGQIGPSGGYLVPPATLTSSFEVNLLAFGGVRQVATEMTTTSGEPLLWPTADDTTNTGVQLGENAQAFSTGVNPTFGLKRWDAYKFSSTPILVPHELLEDSAFDLPSYIGEMLGIRLGRITATKYATGSGASTPEGIVTGTSAGKTTASATAIKPDEILDLIHSIDPAYRSMPGVGFLIHDLVVAYLRKLKDGEGRYIWTPGMQDGVADRLFNYPVQICQELDSTVSTGKKTMLFGAMPYYKIRRVNDVRMYRLEERYRDLDQDGFVAFIREDGKLLSSGTAPVKHLLQA